MTITVGLALLANGDIELSDRLALRSGCHLIIPVLGACKEGKRAAKPDLAVVIIYGNGNSLPGRPTSYLLKWFPFSRVTTRLSSWSFNQRPLIQLPRMRSIYVCRSRQAIQALALSSSPGYCWLTARRPTLGLLSPLHCSRQIHLTSPPCHQIHSNSCHHTGFTMPQPRQSTLGYGSEG